MEVETVKSVQMNTYQSNLYRKELSWLHFNDDPMVQERQKGKDVEPCISIFLAFPTIQCSN